jgi:hypothetical protein
MLLAPFVCLAETARNDKSQQSPEDRGLLASVEIMKMTKTKSAICEKGRK